MTPSLMISASNLLGNVGLQPNATMTSAMTTISINGLVSNYSNLLPGTTHGNTLSARGWTVTNLYLPLYIANANTTISNVSSHYNKMLPSIGNGLYDITKFTAILSQAGAFVTASLATQTMLETFYDQTFDDLGISVTNHSSAVANGLSNIFGTDAQMATLSNGIRRFGTAYDVKNLNKLGDPATFIRNLIDHGFTDTQKSIATSTVQRVKASARGDLSRDGAPIRRGTDHIIGGYLLPTTWQTDDADTLMLFLSNIKGDTLNKIISQTGLRPNSTITDLSQLLDLSKIFNSAELAVVPGSNFAGLANEFINLGGRFNSFTEVANLLNDIEVPVLTYLDAYTDIISDSDYANLSASIGTGTGSLGNPTITDVMGSIAGVTHSTALTTISSCLTTAESDTAGTALNANLANVITQCATGLASKIDNAFAALWSAANTFNSTTALSTEATTGNSAVTAMQSQVTTELNNLSLAGIQLDDITPAGVNGILSMVNNLHDYGVDSQSLNYTVLFEGCRQSNAGGDAIHAALVEGRNLSVQSRNSLLIGTKYKK